MFSFMVLIVLRFALTAGLLLASPLIPLVVRTHMQGFLRFLQVGHLLAFLSKQIASLLRGQGLLHAWPVLLRLDQLADFGQEREQHRELNLIGHLPHQIFLDQNSSQGTAEVLVENGQQVLLQHVGGFFPFH